MPIYEYQCKKCDNDFEYLVFKTDEPVSCPECNNSKVVRKMSACSFKSGGNYTPASGSSSCSGCSSNNCSSCG